MVVGQRGSEGVLRTGGAGRTLAVAVRSVRHYIAKIGGRLVRAPAKFQLEVLDGPVIVGRRGRLRDYEGAADEREREASEAEFDDLLLPRREDGPTGRIARPSRVEELAKLVVG